MVRLNPKQVEWLVYNQPETIFYIPDCGEFQEHNDLTIDDVKRAETSWLFYLTPETYNSLPETFKQLADGIPKD